MISQPLVPTPSPCEDYPHPLLTSSSSPPVLLTALCRYERQLELTQELERLLLKKDQEIAMLLARGEAASGDGSGSSGEQSSEKRRGKSEGGGGKRGEKCAETRVVDDEENDVPSARDVLQVIPDVEK